MQSPSLTILLVLGGATGAWAQGSDDASPADRAHRAAALAQAGKLGPASEEYELLAQTVPELSDRFSYEAGLLFERREALRKADALFSNVSERSLFFPEARLAQARVRRLRGDFKGAVEAVTPITSSALRKPRRRAQAELITLAGLMGDARAAVDAQTAAGLDRAPWLGGAPVLAMISGDFDSLLERNACRDHQRAAKRTPAKLSCLSALLTAEAAACVGQGSPGELQRLANRCPQPQQAARAWMTAGVLEARAGKSEAAALSFRTASAIAQSAPLAGDALFAAFWVGWRANPAVATVTDLERLDGLDVPLSSQDRARIAFWRAKAAQAQGATAATTALLRDVASRYPASYYATLARQRLPPDDADVVALASTIRQLDGAQEFEALEQLAPGLLAMQWGLPNAALELTTLALANPSPAGNRIAVEALNAAGLTAQAHKLTRAVFRGQPGDGEDVTVWQAAFPTHFSGLLGREAIATDSAPELLQGLVREESGFNPSARSHCGALGLMQLMPVTARALAMEEAQPLSSLSELTDPARNVHLGARYLGQLLQRFDRERVVVAAAYNGGPTRVARWLELVQPGQLDEWLETLPLDETRNYAKDVVASADVYAHRLNEPPFVLAAASSKRTRATP